VKQGEKTPDSKNELFVLNHTVCCDLLIQVNDIKIILSTPRLLKNLRKSKMVQMDATFKNTLQGYPVMIAGTSSKNQFVSSICYRCLQG
jgi:hypothetical protein